MAESGRKLTKEERAKKFLSTSHFAKNAFSLFKKAKEIASEFNPLEDIKHILGQMLHSILFLGNIHPSCYKPEYIFADQEILSSTRKDFQESFSCYQTHVALRTPFSYFLELVTKCFSQDNERVNTLAETLRGCEQSGDEYSLISRVICICESGASSYYGASLSCEGDREREIMTAVSCQHVWHPKVSSAVMSVFPEDTGEPHSIKLPDTVRCRAYEVADMRQVKPPCWRCNQLYSLPDHTEHKNAPGNCAETEAISNLLRAEQGVAHQTNITGGVYNHQEIEQRMRECFNRNMEKIMKGRKRRDKYDIRLFFWSS